MKLEMEREDGQTWRSCLKDLLEDHLDDDDVDEALGDFDRLVDDGELTEVAAFRTAYGNRVLRAYDEKGERFRFFPAEEEEDDEEDEESVFVPRPPPQLWDRAVTARKAEDGSVWLKSEGTEHEVEARTIEDLRALGSMQSPIQRKEFVTYFRDLGMPVTRIIKLMLEERLAWARDTMKHVGFPYAGDEDRVVTLRQEEPVDQGAANG